MEEQYTLYAEDIEKSFPGTVALKGVTLRVRSGEIHAIVGENGAGKSTLMNIISGVYSPDKGKIFLNEQEIHLKGPHDAQNKGIGFVHQELALCPHVTAAQNIFMGRLPTRNGIIRGNELNKKAQGLLNLFHADFRADEKVSNLSVAQQQIVEIARTLSLDCNLIIFDEPTSSLNETEAEALFKVIRNLKKKNISVIYISHKLSEIFELCDSVTVMRDGHIIESHDVKSCTSEKIVTQMVGRELGNLYPEKSAEVKELFFRVEGFTRRPEFTDISFCLRRGEILGLSGLVGSGRSELSRAICGIDECQKGRVYINGKEVKIKNYGNALDAGLCYLTEDRKFDGLFLSMNIMQNIYTSILKDISQYKIINQKKADGISNYYRNRMNIKISTLKQKVENLSGGNQQKVMIAKNLATKPQVIIMDEPTRGIDVGAKAEIHSMLRDLCNEGIGIIIISSELPEVVGICDRVIVMGEGKIIGELAGENVNQNNVIQKISQFTAKDNSSNEEDKS
ncbi:MAG: sugar ABC transporter ATP-binding protein [Treponema sp.]|jgi:ribose transport system ATP-binding protein|nr:sugar ABC transporter ATP-binding protein [Treponema sp.]